MLQDKSFGTTLYFSQWGGERPIPDVFVAAMERAEERTAGYLPNATIPQNVKDDVNVVDAYFDTRERRTNEKVLVVVRKKAGNITLADFRTNDQGQSLQVSSTLFYTTDSTFVQAEPSATQDVAVRDLGNGWSIQEVAVMGTYIDGVFTPSLYQGIELTKEVDDWVPERFQVVVPKTQTQSVESGTVVAPTLGVNDLRVSQRQLALYRKLITTLSRQGVSFPVVLIGKRTNEQKQVVTVTETLRLADTAPTPSATENVSVQALGNGYEVVTEEVVPSVFPATEYTKRVEDIIPVEFRVAIPATETETVSSGTALMPTLGAGDLSATQKQLTEFTKLVRTLTRANVSLPVSLVGKDTNDKGQVVTITRTLRVAGTDPTPTALKEVVVQPLGDGNVVETKREIATVFARAFYQKQIEDLLPVKFHGLIPTIRTRSAVIGTATTPTLSTGDLLASEEQLTDFVKLVELLTRAGVSFPVTLVDQAAITEYGGGLVNITQNINVNGTYIPAEGENIVQSKVTKLGNGYELQETISRVAGAWPQRRFAKWFGRLQTFVSGFRQVVAKDSATVGLASGVSTEVEPVDGYREEAIVTTQPLSILDTYTRVLHNNTNVHVPPQLVSVLGYYSKDGGAGSYTENGNYTISAPGVGSLQLHGSAQASASVVPEAAWVVKIPRTQNIPCKHVLLYVLKTATRAQILTAVNVALGSPSPALAPWPDFRPQQMLLLLKGGKANARLDLSASAHDALSLDYAGAIKYSGNSRTNGGGISVDISRMSRLVQIPETIHDVISSFGGDGATSSEGPHAATGSIVCGACTSIPTVAVLATAGGSVAIASGGGATQGDKTIPASGQYLHRLVTEPDPEFDRVRVFAEVVDFADIWVP